MMKNSLKQLNIRMKGEIELILLHIINHKYSMYVYGYKLTF